MSIAASSFRARTSLFFWAISMRGRAASSTSAPARAASRSWRRALFPRRRWRHRIFLRPRWKSRRGTCVGTSSPEGSGSCSRISSPSSRELTTSSSRTRPTSARRRCGNCRANTATSRESRSWAAAGAWTTSGGSWKRCRKGSTRAACWSARWGKTGAPWNAHTPGQGSLGRATKYLLPKGRAPREARPGGGELSDQRRFFRGRGEFGQVLAPDRDVVQLAEDLLQSFQRADVSGAAPRVERRGEEFAAVAQPLQADAHRVTLRGILPVHAARLLHQLAMRPRQRRAGKFGHRLVALPRSNGARRDQRASEF